MKLVTVHFTLAEFDLISKLVAHDRDEQLGGDGRTRLLSDDDALRVPLHQAILQKLEEAVTSPGGVS